MPSSATAAIGTGTKKGLAPPVMPDAPGEDGDDDVGDYFDDSTFKASLEEPLPSEPPSESGDRETASNDDRRVSFSDERQPETETDDEEEDIEDDEDLEDDWEEPSNLLRNVVIAVAALLLLGGGGVGAYWYWQQERSETLFDKAPIINKPSKKYKSALLVGKTDPPAPEQPAEGTPEQPPKPAQPSGDDVVTPPPDEAPEKGTPAPEPGGDGAQPAAAPAPAPAQAAMTEYENLMAKAKKSGRKKKIALLREALQHNPNGDDALAQLSIQLMEAKSTREEALALANRAVSINPQNAVGWMAVGYVNQLNKNMAAAKSAYKKCATGTGPKAYKIECRRLAR
jgi:hypothetical protein